MENYPDELTKNKKYWIKYDSNSCRYDSITFLFFTIFYNYFINHPYLFKSTCIIELIKLTDIIVNNLKNKQLNNKWEISDNNSNLKLNISNIENGYK